ncbi:hypothetical protein ABIE44_000889 [Marmoricola sp. OAE513]|uniref:DUF6941 family protein n=1 Tax=Marmoricola sp. OAE513 TaxID=2817894 RepID=UPI001AEA15BF
MELDVMLCDHAQVSGEKLFISGANIDRMVFPAGSPAPYVVNLSAAGLVSVPWAATNAEHTLAFQMVTEDGQNPPLLGEEKPGENVIGGQMEFNLGRPPQLAAGESQNVPFVFNFAGIPLMTVGRYVLVFTLDGVEARRLSFAVEASG